MTKTRKQSLWSLACLYAAGGFALTLVAAGGMHLNAQAPQNGGFYGHNSRAPVNVDAGRIVAQEREDRVLFSGDVVVQQAGLSVRAARMQLNYTNTQSLELQRITASGGVVVTRGQDRATGESAIYDFGRRIITLAGNVRLQQGTSSLTGGRLVIDLDRRVASVDGQAIGGSAPLSGSPEGRVGGTFSPVQADNGSADTPD